MANRDFEIDLRMKADFASAQRALRDTQADIEKISKATAAANAEIAAIGQGSASAAAGNGGGATSAQQEAGATDALNASLARNAQSREAIAAASRATQQAVTAEIGLIGDLQARLERGAGSFDDLADTEAKLDVAMQKGLISAEEYDDALGKLNEEQARLEREAQKSGRTLDTTVGRYDKAGAGLRRLRADEVRLKDAVDKGRISREQYNRAMAGIGAERTRLTGLRDGATQAANAMRGLNLQTLSTQQNIAQLIRSGLTGQWQSAGTQLVSLGSRAGIVGSLFSVAGIAIVGTTAAIGGLAVAAGVGYLQMRALETALIATGESAGVTAGELADLRNKVGDSTGKFSEAQTAMVALANSGALVGDSLELAARSAVNLSTLTGRSIEDTTNEIIRLAKAPSASLLELNAKYHFLTLAVYDNVRSLEAQGRTQEAVRVGLEALDSTHEQRVANMVESAGTLESAWLKVKKAVAGFVQARLDAGRSDPEGELENAKRALDAATNRNAAVDARLFRTPAQVKAEIAAAQKLVDLAQARVDIGKLEAVEAGEKAQRTKDALDAGNKLRADLEAHASREEKRLNAIRDLELEIAKIRSEDPRRSGISPTELALIEAKRRAQIEEQFKAPAAPKGRKGPKAIDPDEAALRELANLKQQVALLDELEDGETRVSEAARIRYEIENDAFKGASANVQQQLLAAAQELDAGRRRVELAKELKSVDLQILILQGNEATAELQAAIAKLDELKSKLAAEGGNTAGIAQIDTLVKLKTDEATLAGLQREYEAAQDRIAAKEQQIQARRSVGLISETEAQQQIIALYREQGDVLTVLLPKMEAIAEAMGDTPAGIAARANLAQIRDRLNEMLTTVSLLEQKAGEVFEGAFANALVGLATQAKTLGQAVRGFFADMAQGMAQFAAQQLAEAARAKLFSLFNKGGKKSPDLQSPDPAQAAAAGAAYALPIGTAAAALSASAVPLTAAATALSTAAAALAAAGASGGGGGGGSASSSSGWVGLVASLFSAYAGGAAEGGHIRGPGTGTSDSILAHLSDGEFVNRAAVVAQPGALEFLMAFNSRGMQAVADYQNRYNNVGAPRVARPSVQRFHFADGGLAQAAGGLMPSITLRNINLFDIEEIAEKLAASPAMERTFKNHVSANASYVREATRE